jgi:hypothetical protein
MRVNGFRCDHCDKEHLMESSRTLQFFGEGVPDDWYIVTYGGWNGKQEPLLFCSSECLCEHLPRTPFPKGE